MATLYSYDLQGKKDSFSDWISNISPTDTLIVSHSKKVATPQPRYKWQSDSLDKVVYDVDSLADILEGADFPDPDETIGVKYGIEYTGQTQIFKKSFTISDSALAVSTHGRKDELKYQLEKAAKELKNKMEVVFSSRQLQQQPSGHPANVPALTSGLFGMIAPLNQPNPDLPANVQANSAVHVESATTALDIEDFEKVMFALYKAGSKACTIVLNPINAVALNKVAQQFALEIRQLQTFERYDETTGEGGPKKSGYDESYSITDRRGCCWCVCYSRFCPTDLVYFLHPEDIRQRVLREPKATQLAKKGASETWQLVIEAGLELGNPYAAGVIEIKQ